MTNPARGQRRRASEKADRPSGSCSAVFGMDIENDIAYPYTSRCRKRKRYKSLASSVLSQFSRKMTNPIYALILAGGSGERFWPLKPARAAQTIVESGFRSDAFGRNGRPASAVWCRYERIRDPDERRPGSRRARIDAELPKENILAEPAKRDTAAASRSQRLGRTARSSATMLVLPADHIIKDRAAFQKTHNDRGARRGRNRGARHDRNQTNLGVSRVRLHRAGRKNAAA